MKILNTTKGPIGLSPEMVVPEKGAGHLIISEAEAKSIEGSAVVAHYFESGMLVVVDEAAEKAAAEKAADAEKAAAEKAAAEKAADAEKATVKK